MCFWLLSSLFVINLFVIRLSRDGDESKMFDSDDESKMSDSSDDDPLEETTELDENVKLIHELKKRGCVSAGFGIESVTNNARMMICVWDEPQSRSIANLLQMTTNGKCCWANTTKKSNF